LFQPYSHCRPTFRRRLRSADVDTCIVPPTRTRLGHRSFSVAGRRLWNSLPAECCVSQSR